MQLIRQIFLFSTVLFFLISIISMESYSNARSFKSLGQNLSTGVLLVRLNNIDKKINALRENGFEDRAVLAKKENMETNAHIRQAFSLSYRYSDFYFFNSVHSKDILQKKYKNNILDENGNPLDVELSNKEIYVAEYRFLSSGIDPSGNYNGKAFIIKKVVDGELKNLDAWRVYGGTGMFRSDPLKKINRAVKKLNRRLFRFNNEEKTLY